MNLFQYLLSWTSSNIFLSWTFTSLFLFLHMNLKPLMLISKKNRIIKNSNQYFPVRNANPLHKYQFQYSTYKYSSMSTFLICIPSILSLGTSVEELTPLLPFMIYQTCFHPLRKSFHSQWEKINLLLTSCHLEMICEMRSSSVFIINATCYDLLLLIVDWTCWQITLWTFEVGSDIIYETMYSLSCSIGAAVRSQPVFSHSIRKVAEVRPWWQRLAPAAGCPLWHSLSLSISWLVILRKQSENHKNEDLIQC